MAWGDKLFSHYKNKIKSQFKINISETYASAEGLMIAAQKDLEFMYIMSLPFLLKLLILMVKMLKMVTRSCVSY